jgi:hypothetical protein
MFRAGYIALHSNVARMNRLKMMFDTKKILTL